MVRLVAAEPVLGVDAILVNAKRIPAEFKSKWAGPDPESRLDTAFWKIKRYISKNQRGCVNTTTLSSRKDTIGKSFRSTSLLSRSDKRDGCV